MVFIARQLIMQMGTGNGRENRMQLAMLGLGRMGANMARRLLQGGHDCVVYDPKPETVGATRAGRARPAPPAWPSWPEKLTPPRVAWIMVPAGEITDATVMELASHFAAGDVIVDGGNSHFKDDVRRARLLAERGIIISTPAPAAASGAWSAAIA
jgi:6-phosphogluconate dehydrogenase